MDVAWWFSGFISLEISVVSMEFLGVGYFGVILSNLKFVATGILLGRLKCFPLYSIVIPVYMILFQNSLFHFAFIFKKSTS